ncbi:MAG TPA: hypothetical protein DC047_05660 [Blastocatellia bacterium]|nr:hypothetical protein [Blastocatellia bacterium]
MNGFVNIRPVLFRNEPKPDTFLVLPLVFTTMVFLLELNDRLRSDSLGIGFRVGSGFKRGKGFNPGKAGIGPAGFDSAISNLSAGREVSSFAFRIGEFSEVAATFDTTGNGWDVCSFGF